MKIVIDARPLSRGFGGIQRYLEEILPYFVENKLFTVILYTDSSNKIKFNFDNSSVQVRQPSNSHLRFLKWIILSSYWLFKDKPDLIWSPRHHLPLFIPKETKKIVTIHDLVWKTAPKTMPLTKWLKEAIWMPLALRKADQIIAVSETTRFRLLKYFPAVSAKVKIIKNGGFTLNNINEKELAESEYRYFLTVGTIEPRKNYSVLLEAFEMYNKLGGNMKLVVVGGRGWKTNGLMSSFKKLEKKGILIHESEITDFKLHSLYRNATALISFSLDEGYGLPIEEAKGFNLPMLLSDIPVYREIAPPDTTFLLTHEIDSIVKEMINFDSIREDDIRHYPPTPIRKWANVASEMMNSFEAIVES